MRIGVLGTGPVGHALGTRLAELGHEVTMGSRDAANAKAVAWARDNGGTAGTFADAVRDAELVVNATSGGVSLAVMKAAGGDAALAGKVLLDISNPLDYSTGQLVLTVVNTDSVGEQLQRALPGAMVVKSLNTVNANVMVHPELIPGEHTMFMAGDHATAKETVARLLMDFGWPERDILDLGGITGARAMEMYLPLWVSMWQATGTLAINVHVVRGDN
jgi:predicted dinucleotide-binding enzyme